MNSFFYIIFSPIVYLCNHVKNFINMSCLLIKKTRRLASPVLGRRQKRSCTYTLFLKFLTMSNWHPARNLYFLKVWKINKKTDSTQKPDVLRHPAFITAVYHDRSTAPCFLLICFILFLYSRKPLRHSNHASQVLNWNLSRSRAVRANRKGHHRSVHPAHHSTH